MQEDNIKTILKIFLVSTIYFAINPSHAVALQVHSASEGLYVHQMGHVLYAMAMTGMAYAILKSNLSKKRGWRLLSYGALLLTLWNIWAFFGHIVDIMGPHVHVTNTPSGTKSTLILKSCLDYCYFILKLDHVISVPALLLLYLGLKAIQKESA